MEYADLGIIVSSYLIIYGIYRMQYVPDKLGKNCFIYWIYFLRIDIQVEKWNRTLTRVPGSCFRLLYILKLEMSMGLYHHQKCIVPYHQCIQIATQYISSNQQENSSKLQNYVKPCKLIIYTLLPSSEIWGRTSRAHCTDLTLKKPVVCKLKGEEDT